MASGSPNKNLAARAAAILTTAEVAASSLDVNETFAGELSVQVDFTLGSLTNVTLRAYVSMDGTNWYDLTNGLNGANSVQLTASGTKAYIVSARGWKLFRVSAQGSGTVTSSSLALTYRYQRRGSQA